MQQPLLVSSSDIDIKSKIPKIKYFYKVSAISSILFSWIGILLEYGSKNTIKQQNLEDLKMEDRAQVVYQKWSANFTAQKNKLGSTQPLKKSIKATFTNQFIIAIAMDFLAYTLTIMTPVMIYLMSLYLYKVGNEEKSVGKGIMWLCIVSVVRFFRTFFDGHAGYKLTSLGADVGNALTLGMVKKSLKYSVLCNKNFKMGQLANLLQVDCFRLGQFPKNLSSVINIIYLLVFSIGFMGFLVGPAFLSGFGVILIASGINMLVSRLNAGNQIALAQCTDDRMKSTNEVFNNIKFIKVNVWQQHFYDKLQTLRKAEIKNLKSKYMMQTISTFSMWLTPKMILVATFGTYAVFSPIALTFPIAFAFTSLFGYMQFYLQFLPNSLSVVVESFNAIKRIQKYLLAQEVNLSCITHSRYQVDDNADALIVQNGNFFWDQTSDENQKSSIQQIPYHLKDINFRVKKGQMVAIVGGIGSGKSSLLYSLLGEMKFKQSQNRPNIIIDGSMSLVTQKPWITNDTVRKNILFGKPYNKKKYQDVVKFASLTKDFQLFTHGDKTMIGEKGSTLSGGQKARISFARSLYSQSDILLLDDLLSAVDVHVGKFIMTETLLKYVKDKTRILVTHALYYLKYVDKVILMEDGKIVEQGNYDKLKNSKRFRDIYDSMMKNQKKKKKQSVDVELLDEIVQEGMKEEEAAQDGTSSKMMKASSNLSHLQQKSNKDEVGKILEDPTLNELMMAQQTGGEATSSLYNRYTQYNGGMKWVVLLLFSMFGWLISNVSFNVWLTYWTNEDPNNPQHTDGYYVGYYALLGVIFGVFSFFRALILSISSPQMSLIIHEKMITNLLFSPLNQFFDRVPLGRIINRLSKDLNAVDTNLPVVFSNFVVFCFFLLSNIVIVVYCTNAIVIIPILIFLLCVYFLKNYYMKTNKELVRLQGITKSPVISSFTEILNGVATIRAYQAENSFFLINYQKVNENKKPCVVRKASEVWFTLRLTALSFIVNVSALSVVFFTNIIDIPSQASLMLVMALSFDEITYFLLTNQSNFESELISLERCEKFTILTPQRGYVQYLKTREISRMRSQHGQTLAYKSDWPDRGQIKFISFKVKYRQNLDFVLRGLTVTFQGGQKIGVVGRTGSGKSTIMLSILRILQASFGQIIIDGKDISTISLNDLRNKITIILQDPCLFAGNLKQNLDPLNVYSTQQLWQALQKTALKQTMQSRGGLQCQITQNGENLSVGERQLVSITRAILKPTKIVLVDQATANIDVKTQGVIYQAMNDAFRQSTVITVAHRINTVINSDKILVLDGGQLKQYDNPQTLLKNPNSFFASLYNQSQKESKM